MRRKSENNAEEGTRTPTAFQPPAPKAGASANSATSASAMQQLYKRRIVAPTLTIGEWRDGGGTRAVPMKLKRFEGRSQPGQTCFFLLRAGYFVRFAPMGRVSGRRDATLHKMRSCGRRQRGILSELRRSVGWSGWCGNVERNDTNGNERKCCGSAVLRAGMGDRVDFLHYRQTPVRSVSCETD